MNPDKKDDPLASHIGLAFGQQGDVHRDAEGRVALVSAGKGAEV